MDRRFKGKGFDFVLGNKTYICGILNLTPDSFSDGGSFDSVEIAVEAGLEMVRQGADIIDIGGESTRPGHTKVTVDEELDRVIPVISRIRKQSDTVISIDTTKPEVAKEAVRAGVNIINDVSGRLSDDILQIVAENGLGYIPMHAADITKSEDPITEVSDFFRLAAEKCRQRGISSESVCFDYGIGFGKTAQQNLLLLKNTSKFVSQNALMVALSRKSFLGVYTGEENPRNRDYSTAVANAAAIAGGADIIRVHNIKAAADTVNLSDWLYRDKA